MRAPRTRVAIRDVGPLAMLGIRVRPLRAGLSAMGVAIGIATIVTVLGVAASSRSKLVAQIDALGTNLLAVAPSQTFPGSTPTLPPNAPAMLRRIGPVLAASAIGDVNAQVYRNDRVSAANTEAVSVYAAQTGLLRTLEGRVHSGRFLGAATANYPAVVLGADTAAALGVDRADSSVQLWLGGHWFAVTGILDRLALAPELDRSALIGFPVAQRLLHATADPVEVYVRTDPASVRAVEAVVPATANPAAPQDVSVTDPTDALAARADAKAAFQSLFLALGAVALLVSGLGIANVMVISVLERRTEIGLRRALGATPADIGLQFIAEAALLATIGGAAGAAIGSAATSAYASARGWGTTVSPLYLVLATGLATLLGAVAGTYPALRAARMTPAEALRTV